jgi:kynurenine formamidase
MRIIDLSMPVVADHVRWKVEQTAAQGAISRVTTIRVSCHSFTHVDARRHYFVDGATIEATPLEHCVGSCAVVDLMDAAPNVAIGPEQLAARGRHIRPGDIVLLKSGWHRHRSFETREFWTEAPYLTREAALWLKDTGLISIAYDFPQDYCIRLLLDGISRPIEEHVTHDVLLRAGVTMIEYLTNTAALTQERIHFSAAPIRLPGSDGAPARAYAIEGLQSS